MRGLTYIRKDIFHMTVSWLATEMSISRQGVTDWESNRSKMSNDRLEALEKIFGVSQKWYNKEIDEIDKLKIDNEVLNNIISTTLYDNIKTYDDVDMSKLNVRFEETTVDFDKILKIQDISIRNQYVIKQIDENNKKIELFEVIERLNLKGKNLADEVTIFNMYVNCLTIFDKITDEIEKEDKEIQDIKFAKLKQYLMNYKNVNN